MLVLLALASASPITIDDALSLQSAWHIAPSPDGTEAIVQVARWDEASNRRASDLWRVDLDSGDRERLTFDRRYESRPVWSPDGRWVYFRASDDRPGESHAPFDGTSQVFRMDLDSRAVTPVTETEEGVNDFQLSADGASLYFTTRQKYKWDDAFASLRKRHKLDYGHGVQESSTLHRLDLGTWRSEELIDEDRVIFEFAVSPDEQHIAMVTTPDEELIFLEGWSQVDVYEASSGELRTLDDALWRAEAPSPFGWLYGLAWSDDGTLAHRVDFDGHPGQLVTTRWDGAAWASTRVDHGAVTLRGDPVWRPGSEDVCTRVDDHARTHIACFADGAPVRWTDGDVAVSRFAFDPKGRSVMWAGTSRTSYTAVFSGRRGQQRRAVDLNPQTADWPTPQVRDVSWTAADGTTVEGVLELPEGWTEDDGPLPLVVSIHGGPTAATSIGRSAGSNGRGLFPSDGWALLSPNYRGSTGYGDPFMVELIGHECDIEVHDILSGVDALVERGLADADRMAVMGWSNGGFLTNCIITSDTRFKAASSGAGVFDQVLQWATEDTPGHVINYMEGLPWETPEAMHAASPLYRADQIETPTLIHVGENDERVPRQHAEALYRALFQYLDVPVELVVYPNEGHGLSKYKHRKAKMAWDKAWFDHYVLGTQED